MKDKELKEEILKIFTQYFDIRKTKIFIFGSFLKKKSPLDLDLGLLGEVDEDKLALLRFDFEESNFPYEVDLVNFNRVEKGFKEYVLGQKIRWLT
jgi:predicted nucleotidyltransferase